MTLSWTRAWRDASASFRETVELLLPLAGIFLFLPAVASGFIIPEPVLTAADPIGRLNELVAHLQKYQLESFLLAIPTAFGQIAILTLLLDPSRPTVGEALRRALTLLVSFILLNNFLIMASVAFGLVLLLLPGLYLIGRLAPAVAAMASERLLNPLAAYGRGWSVTRGNGWRVFGIIAIVLVVAWVLEGAATTVIGSLLALFTSDETARAGAILLSSVFSAAATVALLLLLASIYRQLTGGAPAAVSLSKGI